MYGLGWYVQDFKGQRLLWHTGRWPPSTSALYLKVPDENLTFIVLANTDNLTVPFFGLGNGDVSKSLLALSFYRHFIFPEQHGFSPPMIDWEADERGLIQQLAGIEDKDAREFAERELWSFRQAYASVGRHDQAEKLRRVDIKAYPRSDFRGDDLFTQTAGSYPVITPALRAASFVSLIRGIALWFFLVFISIFWMAIRMLRAEQLSRWEKMLWLAATLFLGPVSILIQLFSHPRSARESFTRRQLAWQASAFAITGYAVAWVLAVSLIMSGFGQEPHPLMILAVTYLIPLLVGAFLIRIPRLQKPPAVGWGWLISQALLAEAITWNLGFAVFFSLTFFISNRLLTSLPHPTSPFFWAMLSVIAVPGVVSLLPLQYWMVQRGYSLPSSVTGDKLGSAALPEPGSTWPAFFITFVVSMAALAIAIGQLG